MFKKRLVPTKFLNCKTQLENLREYIMKPHTHTISSRRFYIQKVQFFQNKIVLRQPSTESEVLSQQNTQLTQTQCRRKHKRKKSLYISRSCNIKFNCTTHYIVCVWCLYGLRYVNIAQAELYFAHTNYGVHLVHQSMDSVCVYNIRHHHSFLCVCSLSPCILAHRLFITLSRHRVNSKSKLVKFQT